MSEILYLSPQSIVSALGLIIRTHETMWCYNNMIYKYSFQRREKFIGNFYGKSLLFLTFISCTVQLFHNDSWWEKFILDICGKKRKRTTFWFLLYLIAQVDHWWWAIFFFNIAYYNGWLVIYMVLFKMMRLCHVG